MARSGAFGKRGKFLGAGIAVLAVLSLLLYYGVASGTDFVRTDRLWSFEASAKILVLGLSIAVIVYLGISLLKNRLSLRRYTLLAWSWFVVFFLFAGLTGALFPQKIPRDIHWRIRLYRPKVSGCKRNAAKRHAANSARAVQTPYTVAFAIARRFSASPSGILP